MLLVFSFFFLAIVGMTRQKVKLAYISDLTARKSTYKKRKKGIIKKVSELTILCGISACAIISSPFEAKAEIWPDPEGAKKVIEKYLDASVIDESKNVNQESFLMQRIGRAQEQLKKLRQENEEKEKILSIFRYIQGEDLPTDIQELKQLKNLIQNTMKETKNKMDDLNSESV